MAAHLGVRIHGAEGRIVRLAPASQDEAFRPQLRRDGPHASGLRPGLVAALIERPAGAGGRGNVVDDAKAQALEPRPGDHRAVVAAKLHRRRNEPQARLDRKPLQRLTHHLVGRDAAGDDEGGRMTGNVAEGAQPDAGAVDDDIDDRRLKAGAEIGHIARS